MNVTPYFEASTLFAHFKTALEAASRDILSIEETAWLSRLADETAIPENMRVEALKNAQPASTGCLVFHQRNPALKAVYLYSPLRGVQGFDNLRQLESSLQSELAHLGVATQPLQFVELAYPVFEQWSQQLLQEQIDLLGNFAEGLSKLPTLRSVMDDCVTQAFSGVLDGTTDIAGHRLQVVAADDVVLRTETLCDSALDLFSGQPLGIGLRRRYLRGDAVEPDPAYHDSCEAALLEATIAVPGAFARTLREYWAGADNDVGSDRRDALALGLADDYARVLIQSAASGQISAGQLEWLRELLIPDVDTLSAHTLAFAALQEGDKAVVPIADSLVLQHRTEASQGLFVSSASGGLLHFADREALKRHCIERVSQAPRWIAIAQDHWNLLQDEAPTDITLTDIDQGAFLVLADNLSALIARRLAHALRFPGAQTGTAAAAVEDALDIRALIDSRLAHIGDASRWITDRAGATVKSLPEPLNRSVTLFQRMIHASSLVSLLKGLKGAQPDIRASVIRQFAPAINALCQGELQPQDLWIKHNDEAVALIDFFLGTLSGSIAHGSKADFLVLDRHQQSLAWPSAEALWQQIGHLKLDFSLGYLEQHKAYDEGQVRFGKGVTFSARVMHVLTEALLRIELAMAREDKLIDADLLDLLQHSLDSPQPTLANARFRILALSLKMPGKPHILPMTSAFVLQRAAPEAGTLLLWSPLEPLTQFHDEQSLLDQMNGAFEEEPKLVQWMDLIHAEDLIKWHTPSVLPGVTVPELVLTSVGADLLGHLSKSAVSYRANTRTHYLSYAIRNELDGKLLQRFVDLEANAQPIQKPLKRLHDTLQIQYFRSLLPTWLKDATPHQLRTYSLLLQNAVSVSNSKFNYLFDIPKLDDFAHQQLSVQLAKDFPTLAADPALITVTYSHVTPSPVLSGETPSPLAGDTVTTSKSLTEFALTHSGIVDTASNFKVSVSGPNQAPLPLDARKVRDMVDALDVGRSYRTLLADKLSTHSADYGKRRERYSHTATAYLMEEGYQQFLEKRLSAAAMYYLSHVLAKPDGLARDDAMGQKIVISNLQLRAAEGFAPDTVRGMYLIGPDDVKQGPVLLYCAYRPEHRLMEFKDQEALRAALLLDTALQQDILARVPDGVRSRYDHQGFLHPHLFWDPSDLYVFDTTPGPVQLVRRVIEGNALHVLYDENALLLIELAKARTVTTAEAYWQVFRYVLGLAIEQGSLFLPGKLAAVIATLQSAQWLKGSAEAALKHNWGESLAEFVTALGSLASNRMPHHALSKKGAPSSPAPEPAAVDIDPAWTTQSLRPQFSGSLANLRCDDIQLKDLSKNAALNLYVDTTANRYFAAVAGNVYEVGKPGEHWRIIKDGKVGPDLKEVNGQWQIDLKEGLLGGGIMPSCFDSAAADLDIALRFTTLASGMKDISALHPLKHAMLVRAYDKARHYLETALENLEAPSPQVALSPRTLKILSNAFGHVPSPQAVEQLRDYTKRILTHLLSDPMKPASSKRIVVGVNMPGYEDTVAFVYDEDPGKRIFLTERFFTLPWDVSVHALASDTELLAHQQAVSLIHEISHQILRTVDIAYVEASSPFIDQLSRNSGGRRNVRDEILAFRRNGLSVNTSPHTLFKVRVNMVWRDIVADDGRAFDAILKLTKTDKLVNARAAFYTNPQIRTDIIMANADSLSWLIAKLGRTRFAPIG